MLANLETTGIIVGEPDPNENKFELVITDLDTSAKPPTFYLSGTFGPDEKDLFLNRTDAEECKSATVLPANWMGSWTFKENNGTFELKIYTYARTIQGPLLRIEFGKVTSKTTAGNASLAFRTDPDPKKPLQTLSLEKKTPLQPGIIAFYSDPPEGTQNLPGATVALKWVTFGLTDLKLVELKAKIGVNERNRGSRQVPVGAIDQRFTLEGFGGVRPVSDYITVSVLQSRWYDRAYKLVPGDPAYPEDADSNEKVLELQPTEIINANDACLYGVFRHVFNGSERALLFKADNPFARWDLVESSVRGQQGRRIPDDASESPGVYWDDRIWLVGGSQIDPNPGRASNLVWRLDPNSGENPSWENLGPAGWRERMGHAVLVFQNQIWVMGGRDEAGNALNDVWRLNKSSTNWERVAEHAEWAPRCLMHPTVWNDQIWLYGGVAEPFSSIVHDDIWVYPRSGGAWVKQSITDVINKSGTPVSSSLQVFGKPEKVHLFGNFRTIESRDSSEVVKPCAWSLDDVRTQTWVPFPNEGLKDWGGSTTFSYQMINFKNIYLMAKALDYRRTTNVLKIYVRRIESRRS